MKKIVLGILLFFLLQMGAFSQNLEIKDSVNYFDGNWIVAGIIKNNSTNTFSFVSISLSGKNSDGQLVHTDSTYAFSPIPPNSEIPFRFLTSKENAEDIKTYNMSIDNSKPGGTGSFNYSFSQLSITERNSSFIKYSGEITNNNDSLKQYINIALIGFDENNKLVYVDTTYPKKTSLPANGTSLFDFLVPPNISSKIKTYRCIAYSR